MWVFDGSGSIGDKNYWVLKQFAIDVMRGLDDSVPGGDVRMAAVVYANRAVKAFGLGDYDGAPADDLEDALWDLDYPLGGTATAAGLAMAGDILSTEGRKNVKEIVVLVTDGKTNVNPDDTIPNADAMTNAGIEVFAIGIGNDVDLAEIQGIASTDNHWHYITNYNALTGITEAVLDQTCEATERIDCDDPTPWSDCVASEGDCGPGQQTRTQMCTVWNSVEDSGSDARTVVETEYQDCQIECPPTCDNACAGNECGLEPSDDNCERFSKCVSLCTCILDNQDDVDPDVDPDL